jgi:hypothetical protein
MRGDAMRRRVLNVAAAMLLAVAIGIAALWARSYWATDGLAWMVESNE